MKTIENQRLTEECKIFLEEHTFQVYKTKEEDKNLFLLLVGDPFIEPESWKDKKILCTNVSIKFKGCENTSMEDMIKHQILDMQDTYKEATKTDGSKVNWNPIEI